MPPTLKDDFIAFFEHLTHASPEQKKAVSKAIAKIKTRDIKDTDEDKAACADTLMRFCLGQFGGVAMMEADWKRIKHIEKTHYQGTGQRLSTRHKPR